MLPLSTSAAESGEGEGREIVSKDNYYEVLGVRPNAGDADIELAFKGRRSQYHPDRYAQSDSETQAWATGKMKEINEAYRVLANAELRSEFDRCRDSGKSSAFQPRQEPAWPVRETKDAASILLNPEWEWLHDRIYAHPHIPEKKLQGAISSYAPKIQPTAVLVLLDDTLFGGAKEGLLITSDAIYYKQKFENAKRIPFSAIKNVEPGHGGRVLVNGREIFKADLVDHLAVVTLVTRLSQVIENETTANERSAETRFDRISGVDQLLAIHRDTLQVIRSHGASTPLTVLIARQMECIVGQYEALHGAIERSRRPRKSGHSIDAVTAELALTLLLILHVHGFSKLPTEFKAEVGSEFTQLLSVSELYKKAYRDRFAQVFGCQMELSEKDMTMMSAMFLGRDGSGAFELNLPRDEAITLLFQQLGVPRDVGKHLVRQFEDIVESWFAYVCAAFEE